MVYTETALQSEKEGRVEALRRAAEKESWAGRRKEHDLNTKSARSQDTHIPSPVSSTVSQFLLFGLDDQRCEFISQKHTQTWSPSEIQDISQCEMQT